jgi:hypothetical protein
MKCDKVELVPIRKIDDPLPPGAAGDAPRPGKTVSIIAVLLTIVKAKAVRGLGRIGPSGDGD